MLRASLLRSSWLAAACGPTGLGLGSLPTAAAAACSSSTSGLFSQRGYADEAGKPGEEPAAAATAAAVSDEAASSDEGGSDALAAPAEPEPAEVEQEVPEALIDYDSEAMTSGSVLPPEIFTKRQLAWMGLEAPERYKHFLPALSRRELGSFADEYAAEEFDVEQEFYPTIPEDKPLYDLREVVPEIMHPRSELLERLKRLKQEQHPDMPIAQFVREVVGIEAEEEPAPYPGARPIIRWEIRHVLSVGVTEGHPINKKVKAWVYLRELQRECGLTDAALQHIAEICGPRYNPNKGELKLTSDRYPHREANRAHILQIINDLVEQGHRRHPAPPQQQQQQQAEAAA